MSGSIAEIPTMERSALTYQAFRLWNVENRTDCKSNHQSCAVTPRIAQLSFSSSHCLQVWHTVATDGQTCGDLARVCAHVLLVSRALKVLEPIDLTHSDYASQRRLESREHDREHAYQPRLPKAASTRARVCSTRWSRQARAQARREGLRNAAVNIGNAHAACSP
eukprot:4329293-Pleurochrysis_carterae.AAC.1